MFETSVVHAEVVKGRYSLLTVSLIAHSAVVVGALAFSVASVDFPTAAPNEFALAPTTLVLRVPPPLGDPNGGRRPETPKPEAPKPQPQTPSQITAPPAIPDTVTTAQPQLPGAGENSGPSSGTGTVDGPVGVPWGVKDSLGDLDAPPVTTTQAPVEEKIYEVHEVKAPVPIVKTQPQYPTVLLKTKQRATVIVRCVIDKNGRVRDPQVIVPAAMAPFNDAVLRAVQQWRYTPGSRNGQAVDTYLNVTVHFAVN